MDRQRGLSYLPMQKVREDSIQDVVGRGGAGDRVDRPQGGVKIQQQHLVRDRSLAPPREPSPDTATDSRSSCSWRRLVMKPVSCSKTPCGATAPGSHRAARQCPRRSGRTREAATASPARAADRTCCPQPACRVPRARDQRLDPRPSSGRERSTTTSVRSASAIAW